MTREEREDAINFFKEVAKREVNDAKYSKLAIEALEQEPCEDAISRKDMLAVLRQSHSLTQALDGFEKLPSVTLKQKTGIWIDRSGGDPTDFSVSCNLCNNWFPHSSNFCPNCGVKMIEPQENENKEIKDGNINN